MLAFPFPMCYTIYCLVTFEEDFEMKTALIVVHLIVAVALIVIVLLQSGKQACLSGSIAGGAETFFGKNKGRTIDGILSKFTSVAAIVFLITSLALVFTR
jgi:preprotein translocase subunit SecG